MLAKVVGLVAGLAVGLSSLAVPAAASIRFEGLGFERAFGISANGRYVAGLNGSTAVVWDSADRSLRTLGSGYATAVSDDGAVAVGASGGQPFRWSGMTGTALSSDPGYATRVSRDGATAVGTAGGRAFRSTSGPSFTLLPTPLALATGLSGDGSVVVGFGGGGSHVWTETDGRRLLSDPPGSVLTYVNDLADQGRYATGYADFDTPLGLRAFRYDLVSDSAALINPLPGWDYTFGVAISGDGSRIVGLTEALASRRRAVFLWEDGVGVRLLADLLTEAGETNHLGWTLTGEVTDISADGRTIVGWGFNPERKAEAWRVVFPEPTQVPEPSAIAILVLAVGMLGTLSLACARA